MTADAVETYLANLPADQQKALRALRAQILKAAPKAEETIGYGMPAFKIEGRALVYYAAFKNHLSFFPGSSKVTAEMADSLGDYLTSKGTLQFQPSAPLPPKLVAAIVKARLAEIAAKPAKNKKTAHVR